MDKRKNKIKLLITVALFGIVFFVLIPFIVQLFQPKIDAIETLEPYYYNPDRDELLYSQYLVQNSDINVPSSSYEFDSTSFVLNSLVTRLEIGVLLERQGEFSLTIPTIQAGRYLVELKYSYLGNNVLPIKIGMKVNGDFPYFEARQLIIPIDWKVDEDYLSVDEFQDQFNLSVDRYGNELQPQSLIDTSFKTVGLYDSSFYHSDAITLSLNSGDILTIEAQTSQIVIEKVILRPIVELIHYEDYIALFPDEMIQVETLVLEAEYFSRKSDPSIKLGFDSNPSSTPYSTYDRLLNTIDASNFNAGGHSITYDFFINKAGYYQISLKYLQNILINLPVFRDISIDGEILFQELRNYVFKYDTKWQMETLGNDETDYYFYFTEGFHSISLTASLDMNRTAIESLTSVMKQINQIAMEVKKLTAGISSDTNRDFDILSGIPNLVERLTEIKGVIENTYLFINRYQEDGKASPETNQLKLAIEKIDKLIEKPNRIATNLSSFSEGSSSASQMLGNQILKLTSSPLGLEKIYFHSADVILPKANANGLKVFWEEIKKFIRSFSSSEYEDDFNNEDVITIWVNRPRVYVELMQQMIDETFTPATGIEVQLSLMPSVNKLILANAAGKQPSLALGVPSSTVFEFALRDAAVDLRQFSGYAEIVSRISKGVMIPYVFEDGVYGLPETQNFYLMYYRTDILDKIGLLDAIPDTWEDMKSILPELQNYGMNIYIPLASDSAFKGFAVTLPFYAQANISVISADGMSTTIDSDEGIEAMKLMTELFNTYALPKQVNSFYNHFRYGTLPIGISNNENYVKLLIGAPEIKGNWDIALYPGIYDEEKDEILRYAPTSSTGVMMFDSGDKNQDAFDFIQWWLSTEIQSRFAYDLQTMYGEEFIWFTANREAFLSLAIPENHKEIILQQYDWSIEAPNVPGIYMLEREISNAWNKIVLNNTNPRDTLEQSATIVNRELARKLEEFGYLDGAVLIKPYQVPTLNNIDQWLKEREGEGDGE